MRQSELLNWGKQQLASLDLDKEVMALELEILLAYALKKNRLYVLTYPRDLNDLECNEFKRYIELRRAHMPIAYILGKKDFYLHSFEVNTDVLIPRPESELLVEKSLSKSLPQNARVLDICCGSACLGLSIGLAHSHITQIHCSDISQQAMEVARRNAKRLLADATSIKISTKASIKTSTRTSIQFFSYIGDLYESIPKKLKFHIIVANPPYVTPEEFKSLEPEVKKYEPSLALVHSKPLEFYKKIIHEAATNYLMENGTLYLELNPSLSKDCKQLAYDYFTKVELHNDLAGLPRVLELSL